MYIIPIFLKIERTYFMKNGLVSKILSGGLAAAVAFSAFSPSVFANRWEIEVKLTDTLTHDPSIENLESLVKEYFPIWNEDFYITHLHCVARVSTGISLEVLRWLAHQYVYCFDNDLYKRSICLKIIDAKNSNLLKVLFDEKLINKDDVNRTDNCGFTLLHWAAYYGWLDGVKLFCENGADVNFAVRFGETPVYYASRNGHLDVVKFLVEECHADFNITSDSGHTAVSIASGFGQLEVVK